MFTGIIQDIGEVVRLDKKGDWTLAIATKMPLEQTVIGASIACSGVCLTVIEKSAGQFVVQVSEETLSKTTIIHWRTGAKVNLEPALRMGDELGGHLLLGHVDGLLRVVTREQVSDSLRYVFEIPAGFAKFIAAKGSVSIDGVSLTVNDADDLRFSVNLIPHTQQMTTLGNLAVGDEANFEIDMMARYAERLLRGKLPS